MYVEIVDCEKWFYDDSLLGHVTMYVYENDMCVTKQMSLCMEKWKRLFVINSTLYPLLVNGRINPR